VTPKGVIARLDRAIQYSETVAPDRGAAAYWIPAFAGMTTGVVEAMSAAGRAVLPADSYAAFTLASLIARQTRSGVNGMSMWVMP
jgi:hypothetical protein